MQWGWGGDNRGEVDTEGRICYDLPLQWFREPREHAFGCRNDPANVMGATMIRFFLLFAAVVLPATAAAQMIPNMDRPVMVGLELVPVLSGAASYEDDGAYRLTVRRQWYKGHFETGARFGLNEKDDRVILGITPVLSTKRMHEKGQFVQIRYTIEIWRHQIDPSLSIHFRFPAIHMGWGGQARLPFRGFVDQSIGTKNFGAFAYIGVPLTEWLVPTGEAERDVEHSDGAHLFGGALRLVLAEALAIRAGVLRGGGSLQGRGTVEYRW